MKTSDTLRVMIMSPLNTPVVIYRDELKAMLKREERYEWHDLRKNPDDVPEEDGFYLCKVGTKCRPYRVVELKRMVQLSSPHRVKYWLDGEVILPEFMVEGWREIEEVEG